MKSPERSIWHDKVALITGGSSGIGLAAARLLSAQGAHVWLVARRQDALTTALAEVEAARRSASQCCGAYPADVSDAQQAQAAIEAVRAQASAPDLVINSAGVVHPGYFLELDLDLFHWMMDINYFGTVNIAKAAVPHMVVRGSGHIINISSAAGFLGVTGYTAYSGSKFAVDGFSEALRAEMRPHGVKVSVVFPPDTDTPQLAYDNRYKPPETKAVAGLMHPLSPEWVAEKMLRQAARGYSLIYPAVDVKFWHWAIRFLGSRSYPILDWLTDRYMKKARKNGKNFSA